MTFLICPYSNPKIAQYSLKSLKMALYLAKIVMQDKVLITKWNKLPKLWFLVNLEQYVKDLNPDINNEEALTKLVSRAFKKKVPVEIRTAPAFQMSDATGIKLADMAQTMYSNLKTTGSLVNTFSTTKPFKKTVTFRDQKPQFQRYI